MHASRSDQQVFQLQQLAPEAWTHLLRANMRVEDLSVLSVQTEDAGLKQTRYVLELDGYSDPITLLGRQTTVREAHFYGEISAEINTIAPRCWFSHIGSRSGWVVLSDQAHDLPASDWDEETTLQIVREMAQFHSAQWGHRKSLLGHTWLPFMLGKRRRRSAQLDELPEEWDRSIVSEHALRSVEGLASRWLEAAHGLRNLLDLNGWQNVIEEKHLRAMADLLDDPLPMLHPLRELPLTLVHGYPGIYNWQVSVFDTRTLRDWQQVAIGPGICDLVTFTETYGLLQDDKMNWRVRDEWPVAEETIIDAYILALSAELGQDSMARSVRQAIPAARCLHIMLTWLPRFNQWFANLPSDVEARREMWHAINQIDDDELAATIYSPIAGLRPYLAEVFHRFLKSYYHITG